MFWRASASKEDDDVIFPYYAIDSEDNNSLDMTIAAGESEIWLIIDLRGVYEIIGN